LYPVLSSGKSPAIPRSQGFTALFMKYLHIEA